LLPKVKRLFSRAHSSRKLLRLLPPDRYHAGMSPRLFAPLLFVALFAGTLQAESTPSPPPPFASPARPDTSSTTITATFWNVQWFPGRRPNASRAEENRQIRAVHHDLAQLAPDVVGLEEVRDFKHASLAIEPLSGFKVDACSNFPPREGQQEGQQIAIASRLQPISAWAEAWKPGGVIVPPRGFAFAAYQLSPRQVLLVYALHLKSNRGEIHEDIRIREEATHQLLSHIKAMNAIYGKMGALTCIVGGDFNTAPDEPRFAGEKTVPRLLADGFSWGWQGIPLSSRVTVPPDLRYPAACFDQVFFRGATLVRAWVANTSSQSSDHRAVNAVLNLR
jgi:endonuclease/exonuclease/phosphatase (EEP) superfamily protein YafD